MTCDGFAITRHFLQADFSVERFIADQVEGEQELDRLGFSGLGKLELLMSKQAWTYVWGVLVLGTLSTVYAFSIWEPFESPWMSFVILTLLATIAQLLRVEAPTHQLYYATPVFLFAGLILLPPFLFVLLVIVPYSIQWAKERLTKSPHLKNWYLQPFNISNHIFAGLAASAAYTLLAGWLDVSPGTLARVLLLLMMAGLYAAINHVIVGIALMLARKVSLRESGILDWSNLFSDFVLACLGIAVWAVWQVNVWLIVPVLAPLALMYQALQIPRLKKEAETDEKTGLWNARHFAKAFNAELQRARRFNHPLAVIMSDLDLLRNVNNTYGHLAGDNVLKEIGGIIRATVREYDIAGRFGGEEFIIALPETDVEEAHAIAERLRQTIENNSFQVQTTSTPLRVTMSFGVAVSPQDASTANDLIHQADLAVYQAKLKGRNRVVLASDVPHSAKIETVTATDRLAPPTYGVVTRAPELTEPSKPASVPVPEPKVALPQSQSKVGGFIFLGLVISMGVLLALFGIQQGVRDWTSMLLLASLAVFAELFQVRLYGDSTFSVSASICFAAALILGVPGVLFVSLAIVLTHFVRNFRIPWYKPAFNWATHVIAASVPAIAIQQLGISVSMANFIPLVAFTMLISIVYYVVESGLVTLAISMFQDRSVFTTWLHEFRWMVAYYVALCCMGLFMAITYQDADVGVLGILGFAVPMSMLYYAQKQYVERTEDSVNELQRMNQELTVANRQIVSAHQAMHQMNNELFLTLSKIIDARDPFVLGHATQVAAYATAIAKQMNLPADRLERVRQAALLHDIGKIGIPERVLHKPAKLSLEEYDFVKGHAELGAEFLETSQGLRHLAPFIRHHHEWWNGKGYPSGLLGEQTPLEARILAVCDAVEAMASDRAYHRAMKLSEIIQELEKCAGTQFDPAVVKAFVRVAERDGVGLVINSARQVVKKHRDSVRGLDALLFRDKSEPNVRLAPLAP